MAKHHHRLFGLGPNNEVCFRVEVDAETDCTDCTDCIHNEVCGHDMEK